MKNIKLQELIEWSLLIICYLFVEWIYNQHLLVVLSYANINPDNFEFTEFFGKSIASFGLNIIIKKTLKYNGKHKFFAGLVVGYFILTFCFNYVIDSFPNEFRHSSYYSMLYRKDVINQNDDKKIISFTNDKPWYIKSVLLSYFFFTLHDSEWNNFETKIREPLDIKLKNLNKNKDSYWISYSEAEHGRISLEKGWNDYSTAMIKYNQYKYMYKRQAYSSFIKKVGLQPELDKSQFMNKKGQSYANFLNKRIFDGNIEAHINPIYGKDIPISLNKDSFFSFIDSKTNMIYTNIAPNIEQIRNNTKSSNAVAVLVIPPISIGLSLFSIIINTIILGASWIQFFLTTNKFYKRIITSYTAIAFIAFFGIFYYQNNLFLENNYWTELEQKNAKDHYILSKIWIFPIKMESLLCVTQDAPKFIVDFTKFIYKF